MISNLSIPQTNFEKSTTAPSTTVPTKSLINMNFIEKPQLSSSNNLTLTNINNNNNITTENGDNNQFKSNNSEIIETITTTTKIPSIKITKNHKSSNNTDDYISAATYDKFIENMHNYSQPPSNFNKTITHKKLINNNQQNHDSSTRSSKNNSEVEEEDEEKSKSIESDDKTPDHHARRPMNAFLIFCKRHRSIVREKYPNLENRSITKILGDWWANLDKDEKFCYTTLAKQYKDAFFTANPNFKWYKLPAPPLRTHSIRPGITDRQMYQMDYIHDDEHELYSDQQEDIKPQIIENVGYTIIELPENIQENNCSDVSSSSILQIAGIKQENVFQRTSTSSVGVFKLADETQMGGLSSLMHSNHTNNNNNIGENESDHIYSNTTHINVKREQIINNALIETIPLRNEPFSNMRDHAEKMEKSLINNKMGLNSNNNNKRKCDINETEILCNNKKFIKFNPHHPQYHHDKINATTNRFMEHFDLENNSVHGDNQSASYIDDGLIKKSSRACKGKRYREFMNTGKLQTTVKKPKNRIISTPVNFPHNSYCLKNNQLNSHMEDSKMFLLDSSDKKKEHGSDETHSDKCFSALSPTSVDPNGKLFDASDFDLEEKIKALPSLSLDKYLTRKRETKKKKKVNNKAKTSLKSSYAIHEARDKIQNSIVGSQKRKARKESITRRDILAPNDNNNAINKISESKENENNVVFREIHETTRKPIDATTILQSQETTPQIPTQTGTSDLFILATLAEEEAKKNHVTDIEEKK